MKTNEVPVIDVNITLVTAYTFLSNGDISRALNELSEHILLIKYKVAKHDLATGVIDYTIFMIVLDDILFYLDKKYKFNSIF